jgi:hypothetical protein
MSSTEVDATIMTSIQTKPRNGHHYRSFSEGFDDIGMRMATNLRRYPGKPLNDPTTTSRDSSAAGQRRDTFETQRQYRRYVKNKRNSTTTGGRIFRSDADEESQGIIPTAILSRQTKPPTNGSDITIGNDTPPIASPTVIDPIFSLLNEEIDVDQSMLSRIIKDIDSKWLQQYPAPASRYSFALMGQANNDVEIFDKPRASTSTADAQEKAITANSKIDVDAAVEAICSTFDITELCRGGSGTDNSRSLTKSTIVFPSENWALGLLSTVIIPRGNPWEVMTLDQLSSMENAGMYHRRLTSLVNGQEEYMGEILRLR